ncbi:MAG: gliding motility lipoprotein GldH [Bacteroidia bacterium]|nr:gliding motility lipoprotein GldH [Bacteroidia bacterium]
MLLLSLILSLQACDDKMVIDENKTITNRNWDVAQPLHFDVSINDTISSYNMYVNVRNSNNYKFSNLYIFMHTKWPTGENETDTLQLFLASPDGKWLGNGLGDIYENQIQLKQNFKFYRSGQYRFTLEQAMRLNPLPGIIDMGIRIEKNKP